MDEMRECDGHESLRGDMMGATDYCDGRCRKCTECKVPAGRPCRPWCPNEAHED